MPRHASTEDKDSMKDLLMMAKHEDGGIDFGKFKKLYTSKYVNGDQKR